MSINWAEDWINKQNFVSAKSYESTFPHFYTTRDRCDEFEFETFLRIVRDYGKLKKFYSKQYIYLEIGEFEYWEMGRPIKAVQVLNKAKINDNAKYRYPTPTKEEENMLKAKLNKRDCVLEFLLNKRIKSESDERIIKFLMNNERRIHGGGKNIIDHSKLNIKYE